MPLSLTITGQSAKKFAELTAENTRLKDCAKNSVADCYGERVALHEALEQNYQLQIELEKQIVKQQEQESCTSSFWRSRRSSL